MTLLIHTKLAHPKITGYLPPDHGIKPDYSRPVRDVYMDWALRTLRELDDFELLGWAGNGFYRSIPENIVPLNLPLWVPDLYNRKGRRKLHEAMLRKSVQNIPSSSSVGNDQLTAETMPFSLLPRLGVEGASTAPGHYLLGAPDSRRLGVARCWSTVHEILHRVSFVLAKTGQVTSERFTAASGSVSHVIWGCFLCSRASRERKGDL